jgi:4-hydroxy 2-oxovalerate aldolase
VDSIEVAHGNGLQGSRFNYGCFGAHSDLEWIEAVAVAVADVVEHAHIVTLRLPGIGIIHDLKAAYEAGARIVRVATHCTEADIWKQHIEYACKLGMGTVRLPEDESHDRAGKPRRRSEKMESYGATCIYVVDSGGATRQRPSASSGGCCVQPRCRARSSPTSCAVMRPRRRISRHHSFYVGRFQE